MCVCHMFNKGLTYLLAYDLKWNTFLADRVDLSCFAVFKVAVQQIDLLVFFIMLLG